MVISHIIGLFSQPGKEWGRIRDDECTAGSCLIKHVAVLAAIPAISGFFGTTHIGWEIGASGTHHLSMESAGTMAVLSYFTSIAAIFGIGIMIQWMSKTYGQPQDLSRCVVLAAYVATPLFLVGFMLLYPLLWLNMLLSLPALAYSVFLLYGGLPIVMEMSKEKGFLFSTAVLGVAMVAFVAILAVSVILWAYGYGPVHQ